MADSTVFTDSDFTTDHTLYKQSQNGYKSIWATQAALSSRIVMEVNHDIKAGVGGNGNDRHTVVIRANTPNSADDGTLTGSISVTFSVPRDAAWTDAANQNLAKNLQCLLKSTFVSLLCAGGTPDGDFSVSTAFVPA